MTSAGKSLKGLAGSSLGLRTSNALERALETQRSIDKLTALGAFRDDAISRAARGLYSPEMAKAMAIASGKIAALNLPDPFEKFGPMRSAVEEAMGKIGRIDTTAFGIAHSTAAKLSLLDGHRFGSPLDDRISGAMKKMTAPYAGLSTSMRAALDIDRTALGALSRSQHWADALTGKSARDYAALLGTGDKYRKQFEALNLAARSIAEATAGLNASVAFAEAALRWPIAGIDITTTKMSLFAGAIDVLGPGAGGSQAAYTALLGGYSTPAMLDRPYWRDPRERARYYRDQDVDDGLIDADNAATVQVLIESGVVEGRRTRAGTMTAAVEAGPVKLRIMASRPKMGAFGAIDAFENALRAFVSAKLEAVAGPNWFKQRVPGDITTRAKERRHEAIRAGEPQLSLIHYTDLGDLIGVIMRKDNWGEIFEMVFDRAEWLKVDLERLNTHRRPIMHSRPIEPVQLCEIVLTIRRLVGWMERDGTWGEGCDADI
ncbi:MAG: Swt1 family HEPN domain-containing protein [Novosphingobium sp.]